MAKWVSLFTANVSVQAEARFGADSMERLVGTII